MFWRIEVWYRCKILNTHVVGRTSEIVKVFYKLKGDLRYKHLEGRPSRKSNVDFKEMSLLTLSGYSQRIFLYSILSLPLSLSLSLSLTHT